MNTTNVQITDIKKVWETPTIIEISKSAILGVGLNASDIGGLAGS